MADIAEKAQQQQEGQKILLARGGLEICPANV